MDMVEELLCFDVAGYRPILPIIFIITSFVLGQ